MTMALPGIIGKAAEAASLGSEVDTQSGKSVRRF